MMRRITAVACAAPVLTVTAPSHAGVSSGCSLETVRRQITTQVADERSRDCLGQLVAANKDSAALPDAVICPIFAALSPGALPWISGS